MSSVRVWAAAAGEGSVGATRSILSKALSSAQQATVTPDTGDRGRIDGAVTQSYKCYGNIDSIRAALNY